MWCSKNPVCQDMKTLMIPQLHRGKQKPTGSYKFECHLLQIDNAVKAEQERIYLSLIMREIWCIRKISEDLHWLTMIQSRGSEIIRAMLLQNPLTLFCLVCIAFVLFLSCQETKYQQVLLCHERQAKHSRSCIKTSSQLHRPFFSVLWRGLFQIVVMSC